MQERVERFAVPLVALALAALVAVEIDVARKSSVTCDEPAHIATGFIAYEHRSFMLCPEHPPLSKLLASGTLRVLGVREGPRALEAWKAADVSTGATEVASIATYVHGLLAEDNASFTFPGCRPGLDSAVTAARLPGAVLFPVVAALVAFLWARERFGAAGGLLTLALVGTYSDFLGHGALATTEAPIFACGLLAAWLLARLARAGGRRTLVALGLALGATLTAKASGVFLVAGLVAAAFVVAARPIDPEPAGLTHPFGSSGPRARAFVLGATLAAVVAFGTGWVVYLGRNPIAVGLAARERMTWIPTPILLFGEHHTERLWSYFVVVTALKAPLGSIFLVGLTAWAAISNPRCRGSAAEEAIVHLPALAVVVAASLLAAPLGSRYLLPAALLLFVSAGRLALWAKGSRARGAVVIGALVACLASAISDHPFYITSVNRLVGPRLEAYLQLDDSMDWGQGLKALAAWQRERGVERVTVLSATDRYAGFALEAYDVRADVPTTIAPFFEPERGRVYAVSQHLLTRALYVDRQGARRARELGTVPRRLALGGTIKPSELVGGGFLIFDLR